MITFESDKVKEEFLEVYKKGLKEWKEASKKGEYLKQIHLDDVNHLKTMIGELEEHLYFESYKKTYKNGGWETAFRIFTPKRKLTFTARTNGHKKYTLTVDSKGGCYEQTRS